VGKDLHVEERHPLEDSGVVLLGLAEESGLLVLGGDYKRFVRNGSTNLRCDKFADSLVVNQSLINKNSTRFD
jgi:hypothetical protein